MASVIKGVQYPPPKETLANIDTGAALAGQVLEANGAGGVQVGAIKHNLSDYANIIVIDADGNGDFTTLNAAVAAGGAGAVFVVFGATAGSNTTIDYDCEILGPGSIDIGTLTINECQVVLGGGLYIDANINVAFVDELVEHTLIVENATVRGKIILVGYTALQATLELRPGARVQGATTDAIELSSSGTAGGVVLLIDGAYVQATNNGIEIVAQGGSPILDQVNSRITNSVVVGGTDAITSNIAVNVPAYLNTLIGGVHANVTLPVGGGNVSI